MARPARGPGRRASRLEVNVASALRALQHQAALPLLSLLLACGVPPCEAEPDAAFWSDLGKGVVREPRELHNGREALENAVGRLAATIWQDPDAEGGVDEVPTAEGATAESPTSEGAAPKAPAAEAPVEEGPGGEGTAKAPDAEGGAEAPDAEGGAEAPAAEGGAEAPAAEGGAEAPAAEGGAEVPAGEGGAEVPAAEGGAELPGDEGTAEGPSGEGGKDPFQSVADAIGSITKQADQVVDSVRKQIQRTKPLMNRINSMRAQLCWTRQDLWSHKECLKFLGLQCKDASTGQGVCTKFKEDVEAHCSAGAEKATEEREVYCKIAKKLGIRVGDAEEEQEEDAGEVWNEEEDWDELPGPNGSQAGNASRPRNETKGGDRDGDGVPDEEDAFPDDPKEWSDLDGDGLGDNSDPDIDGDGLENEKDKYPIDSTKWTDDRDGDGHDDKDDAFPDDPKEWSDLDGDGVGDNSDPDVDGDGVPNEADTHPLDSSKAISDRDGDGVPDHEDAFPDDPNEFKDSDGDGVGDRADAMPEDPGCWKEPCEEDQEPPTPSPVFNKVARPLPSQGYDEHSKRLVEHKDQETSTKDWRTEWPKISASEREAVGRICKEHPNNVWCQRFQRQHFPNE